MASLIVSPMLQRLNNTTVRRVPLGDIPDAANSPARPYAAPKRSRDQVEAQENFSFDIQPQSKRQALEKDGSNLHVSPLKQSSRSKDDRVFTKRPLNPQLTAFERRCLATREIKTQQKVDRQEKAPLETLEGIRQWQKHYKKAFPYFVFYFEGITEEVRQKCSKWVRSLGAQEEKFFSKDVTHVVTSRPIPASFDGRDGTDLLRSPSISRSAQITRTINPSLLDRQAEPQGAIHQGRDKFTFEVSTNRRTASIKNLDAESRRGGAGSVDILSKAQEMGMKVWQLEKLQRIMNTMHEIPNDTPTYTVQQTRVKGNQASMRTQKEADLSRMLRNERLHGPSDRDASVTLGEVVPFKGPYIFIRDLDERTRPIMMKEFSKPTKKGDLGEWPQFRAVSNGKCPFVEETSKEDLARTKAKQEGAEAQQRIVETRSVSRTRAAARKENSEDQGAHEGDDEVEPARAGEPRKPLRELMNAADAHGPRTKKPDVSQFCPPPARLPRSPSMGQPAVSTSVRPNMFGGEPAASGLQPSNITSAIRSQMISSTAAGPGLKTGTSREVHGLKRKVLEKNAGPALGSIQTRQHLVESNARAHAENHIPVARQTRRQAQAPLVNIDEESVQTEEEEDVWLAEDVRQIARTVSNRVREEKVLKPGYCENCREKYEDFEDHIEGRRHRKFALTQENWVELDKLLAHLGRPLKRQESEGF